MLTINKAIIFLFFFVTFFVFDNTFKVEAIVDSVYSDQNQAGASQPQMTQAHATKLQKLHADLQACQSQLGETKNNFCNQSNKTMQGIYTALETLNMMLGFQASSSIEFACSKAMEIYRWLQIALAAFKTTCQFASDECISECNSVKKLSNKEMLLCQKNTQACPPEYTTKVTEIFNTVKEYSQACSNFGNLLGKLQSDIVLLGMSIYNAKQCKEDTSLDAGYCDHYPDDPLCLDCEDPANASSIQCICQTNPNDPQCVPQINIPDNLSRTDDGLGSFNMNDPLGFNDLETEDMGTADDSTDPGAVNNMGSGTNGISGGGGGGLSGAGGGSSGAASSQNAGEQGGGASPATSDILHGTSGGKGRGFPLFARPKEGDNSEEKNKNGKFTGKKIPPINLKDFLPGGKNDPNRKVGPDGITGANGKSIWEKVSTRYKAKQRTLVP